MQIGVITGPPPGPPYSGWPMDLLADQR